MDSRIESYINNLHPNYHARLYSVVEKFVSKAIPLWNQTLSPLQRNWKLPPRVQMEGDGYDEDWREPAQGSDEEDGDHWDRVKQAMDERKIIQPEPGEFKTPEERHREFSEKSEKQFQSEYNDTDEDMKSS